MHKRRYLLISHSPRALAAFGAALLILLAASPALAPAASRDYEIGRQAYIEGDYERAYRILAPLAEEGDAESQKMLGIMYDYGHGVRQDKEAALNWYLQAAEQGHPAVQWQVGAKYFRGDGTSKNLQEAARWWELAANGGQVDAQFNLGLMYLRGMGVKADDARAAELFRQAADQGHSHAQYSLAVMYAFGRGEEKDYATAFELFSRSAEQGVAQAQFNLGVFYENGFGVEADRAQAREWYERAAAQGLADATEKLLAMGAEMDAGEIPHPEDLAARTAPSTRVLPPAGPAAEQPPPAPPAPEPATPLPEAEPEPEPAPPLPEPEPEPATPAPGPAPAATASGLKGADWVRRQRAESYTLQIGSVLKEEDIVKFIRTNGIEAEAAYIRVVVDGVTRFNAVYGVYPSYAEAQAAAGELPAGVRQVKPWIRNFGILQKMLE